MGIGECGLFRGLSYDDRIDYEDKLEWLCEHIQLDHEFLLNALIAYPSIVFGYEQAVLSLKAKNPYDLFPSDFSRGKDYIEINGLIWMGDEHFMQEQIAQKLEQGFTTLKMKIGAIDFKTELSILRKIRAHYKASELELRVDANGAFGADEALTKLQDLAEFDIHSIEQPVKAGQWKLMSDLCDLSPVAIALDEELIGVLNKEQKQVLLENIKPQYIILKPSLVGGFRGSQEWIDLAEDFGIGWWITSALESNIGLNAIAQFTYTLNNKMPQGLGTGGLFDNNISSPLVVKKGALHYDTNKNWGDISAFLYQ